MRCYKCTALVLLLLLCSCSNVNNKNKKTVTQPITEPITAETAVVTSMATTTATETTQPQTTVTSAVIPAEDIESDAPKTFPVSLDADKYELKEHYSFKVQKDGVWVYYDNIKAQFLDVDCSWYDSNSQFNETNLDYWHDYDFDGYFDLFIPEGEAIYSGPGKYFRFSTKTGLFVIWDEMNKLGIRADTRNFPDKIVYTNSSDENNNIEQKIYIWDDEQLVLFKREYNYTTEITEDGFYRFCDYYTYENGYEELYRRRRLFYPNGCEWPSVDENLPIEQLLR